VSMNATSAPARFRAAVSSWALHSSPWPTTKSTNASVAMPAGEETGGGWVGGWEGGGVNQHGAEAAAAGLVGAAKDGAEPAAGCFRGDCDTITALPKCGKMHTQKTRPWR
jgi:hypothetical protein